MPVGLRTFRQEAGWDIARNSQATEAATYALQHQSQWDDIARRNPARLVDALRLRSSQPPNRWGDTFLVS